MADGTVSQYPSPKASRGKRLEKPVVGPSALHSAGSSQLLRWAEAPLPPEIQSVQVNRRGLPLPQEEAAVEETKGMGGG